MNKFFKYFNKSKYKNLKKNNEELTNLYNSLYLDYINNKKILINIELKNNNYEKDIFDLIQDKDMMINQIKKLYLLINNYKTILKNKEINCNIKCLDLFNKIDHLNNELLEKNIILKSNNEKFNNILNNNYNKLNLINNKINQFNLIEKPKENIVLSNILINLDKFYKSIIDSVIDKNRYNYDKKIFKNIIVNNKNDIVYNHIFELFYNLIMLVSKKNVDDALTYNDFENIFLDYDKDKILKIFNKIIDKKSNNIDFNIFLKFISIQNFTPSEI